MTWQCTGFCSILRSMCIYLPMWLQRQVILRARIKLHARLSCSLCTQEDWIGLKYLDQAERVNLLDCPGAHMQFSLSWLKDHIILPYLAG